MDFSRIRKVIDVNGLAPKKVCVWGAGGSVGLVEDLTRNGVRAWSLVDPDVVDPSNVARQGHDARNVGRHKVDALRDRILAVNPQSVVDTVPYDCTGFPDGELRRLFDGVDLVVAATDVFLAQARCSELALILNVPFVAVGIAAGGRGGEVVWWAPDRDSCFRCLCSHRYAAQERARDEGRTLDPSSDGADVTAVRFVDAIAVQIVLGLLTRGAENRYGRLIDRLGHRQFIQVSLDPDYRVAGRDVVREKLGIDEDCAAYFAWNTVALSDPDRGNLPCPDCEEYRGHRFVPHESGFVRVRTESSVDPADREV